MFDLILKKDLKRSKDQKSTLSTWEMIYLSEMSGVKKKLIPKSKTPDPMPNYRQTFTSASAPTKIPNIRKIGAKIKNFKSGSDSEFKMNSGISGSVPTSAIYPNSGGKINSLFYLCVYFFLFVCLLVY